MTDETYKRWDVIVKALGAVGLVAAAGIGLGEYVVTGNQIATLETSKLDSEQHKLFFDKQLEYYVKATDTVATLANTTDPKKREELIRTFNILYYGPMVIFEERRADIPQQTGEKYTNDINVERHMVAIHNCILRQCPNGELSRESLALADACRFALSVNWENRVQGLRNGLDLKKRLGFRSSEDQ